MPLLSPCIFCHSVPKRKQDFSFIRLTGESVCGKDQETMAMTPWSTGLFDCCEDMSSCCYGFWCCPCLACTVAGKFGENRCLPLCDILSPAITAACGLPLCVPPAVLSVRVGIRHTYGIKGSLCNDIATSCFCEWCSWCQMHRELKYRKKNQPAVVIMQPGQMRS